MGTSRPLRGPIGPNWERARQAGRRWARAIEAAGGPGTSTETVPPETTPAPADDVDPFGTACRRALAEDLADDPDRYGLRPAAVAAGQRLVDALAALMRGETLPPPTGPVPDDPVGALRAGLVEQVAGDGTLIADSVVRRAAVRCAERLTEPGSPITAALADGDVRPGSRSVTGELFCVIYRMFFGEVVGEFLKTAIAAKLQVMVPVLPVLPLGIGGKVAEWAAGKAVELIPNPCEEKERPDNAGLSLPAVATKLLDVAFRRAAGLESPDAGIGPGIVGLEAV
ncbi:MAG: hypothetical protein HKP61_01800 [Dactylosporangium sp.]|nr:hypothetical protein [Dactylosporangium sp.]NNJ59697.1 hypothetical protein [Dactylosporangium sp.]